VNFADALGWAALLVAIGGLFAWVGW